MSMHLWVSRTLLVGFCFAASVGCDADEGFTDEDEAVALRPGTGWCTHCTVIYSNAAKVNDADLSDIHLDEISTGGVKLREGSSYKGRAFRLDIDPGTDRFIGMSIANPAVVEIQGAQFVGSKVLLEMPGAVFIDLEFTDYAEAVPSWADHGAPITAYRARYLGPQQVYQPLCPSTDPDNQWFTLIPGEIYTPTVTSSPRSVTIACVGEAAAKMKLLDFHPQGQRRASHGERQATLRMITADYCGKGESFTVTGTPVAWRDNLDRVAPPNGEDVLEALWDEHGAICLDTPRVVSREEVDAKCWIPTCDGDESFRDGAVWRTMLPLSADD
jgi:hypothetical protein